MEKIRGTIDKIIYKNDINSYNVCKIILKKNNKECVITVTHPNLHEGMYFEFEGEWIDTDRFGKQFKCFSLTEEVPDGKDAVIKYLSSGFFKGIGPVAANKIVEKFGDETLDILKNNIDRLIHVKGISEKKLSVIKKAWAENNEINEIMVFLSDCGISTLFAGKIYETYKQNCIKTIKENPYILSIDIEGIGFIYCDKVALSMGFEKESEKRIEYGIKHIIINTENNGHCFLYYQQILNDTTTLLKINNEDKINKVLNYVIDKDEIKLLKINNEERYYSNLVYNNEQQVSKKIKYIKESSGFKIKKNEVEYILKSVDDSGNIKLSDEQKSAISNIISKKISVLCGLPGCGKTTTIRYLVKVLYELNINFVLCSPTGRASMRLTEVSGVEASTIHRMLGWDYMGKTFLHNESNKLDCQMIIVDESSMIDINLASALLRATPNNCSVLFCGDPNQLPSVSCGNFFKDLISSGYVDVFELSEVYRQGKGSDIINFTHQINKGTIPYIQNPLEIPSVWNKETDCLFIESQMKRGFFNKNNYEKNNSLYYGMDVVDMIIKMYTDTIKKYYNDLTDYQVIIPMNVGECGTNVVNDVIQKKVNPKSPFKLEMIINNIIFRTGDSVIQTVNNYDLQCFNGEIGKISMINPSEKEIVVEFGKDKRIVKYRKEQVLELKLAYAISIHKSQGSEFDVVIMPMLNIYSAMLYRNLIYTGMTRAKKLLIIIGERSAFDNAVSNNREIYRQTSLVSLLNEKNEVDHWSNL